LIYQTGQPAGVAEVRPVEDIVKKINAITDGRLHIRLAYGGEVCPATEEAEGCRRGVIDIGQTGYPMSKSLCAAASLFGQVVGGMTGHQYATWEAAGGGKELADEMASRLGVVNLGLVLHSAELWADTTIPLNTAADLKKLKMRTYGDGGEILARIGAATIFLPGGEIYESMKRGVINACEYGGPDSDYSMGFAEVAKYMYLGTSRAPADNENVWANPKKWAELPQDLKDIIVRCIESDTYMLYAECIKLDGIAVEKYKKAGVQVAPIPKDINEVFLAEAKKYYDEKMQTADDLYKRVLTSQREWQNACETQGIY
jgi:TRAP-type mannitol/chloroaromatic compound transport system substrate-binding protein